MHYCRIHMRLVAILFTYDIVKKKLQEIVVHEVHQCILKMSGNHKE